VGLPFFCCVLALQLKQGYLERVYPVFELWYSLCSLGDNFHKARIERAMPEMCKLVQIVVGGRARGDERFLLFAHKYLLMTAFKTPMAYEWFRKNDKVWKEWMNDYRRSHEIA